MGKSDKTSKSPEETESLIIELINTADRLFDNGRFEFAIKSYTRVLHLEPALNNLAYVLYMRAQAYKATGNMQLAKNDWQRVLNLQYQHPLGIDLKDLSKLF